MNINFIKKNKKCIAILECLVIELVLLTINYKVSFTLGDTTVYLHEIPLMGLLINIAVGTIFCFLLFITLSKSEKLERNNII